MKKRASTIEFELLIARLCCFAQGQSTTDKTTDDTSAQEIGPGTMTEQKSQF